MAMSIRDLIKPAGEDSGYGGTRSYPYSYLGRDIAPEVDLRELLRKLWRRKMVVIGTVVVITTVVAIVAFQLTPRYKAAAAVMIESRNTEVVNIDAVVSGLPKDFETIQSEIQVIQSRDLAEKVIQKLGLYDDPAFNDALRRNAGRDGLLILRSYLPEEWTRIVFGTTKEKPLPREEQFNRERVQVINAFLANLEVETRGRSRVIDISFESTDPVKAARIANGVANLYLVEQLEAKFDATRRATAWLQDRLADLRKKVEASERAVEEFRRTADLIQVNENTTLAAQQTSELNTQLIIARSKRAEADARLKQVRNLLSSGGVDSAAEVLSSPLIQNLRQREADVLRRAAELSTRYGEKHPRMINVRAELRDLRTKIEGEVNKIIQNLRNEVAVARARENTLAASLKKLEQKIAALNAKDVQLRILEREAKANRTLYETFLTRFKETSAQQELQQTDARLISRADVPTAPSFPKKRSMIMLAFIGSWVVGLGLAFLIEQLDRGFRSMEQVERLMGIPSLGLVPLITGLRKIPESYIVEKPTSAFSEAIRSVHTGFLLSDVDVRPRTILVTSAQPQEGKTAIAIALGRMIGFGRHKAIIVDADLRHPQIHKRLDMPLKPGLVEFLAGQCRLEDAVRKDEKSGADVLGAGGPTSNAADLLSSDQMKRLLSGLAGSYDLVVIDSPPVLAVSDARILSRLADRTVFVVRWAATRREVAALGAKQILDAGGKIAGVVLSMVNVRRHARYGFSDSGYYYGLVKKYYTS